MRKYMRKLNASSNFFVFCFFHERLSQGEIIARIFIDIFLTGRFIVAVR